MTRFCTNSDVHPGGNVVKPREIAFKEQVLVNIISNCFTSLCHQPDSVLNAIPGEAPKHLGWLPGEVEAHNRI